MAVGGFLKEKPIGAVMATSTTSSVTVRWPWSSRTSWTDTKSKGYLEDKQRMGQNGFIYLKEPATALRMIDEAIALNPNQSEKRRPTRLGHRPHLNAQGAKYRTRPWNIP